MDEKQLEKLSMICSGNWHIDFFHGLSYFANYIEKNSLIETASSSAIIKDIIREKETQGLKILTDNGFVSYKDKSGSFVDIPKSTIAKIKLSGAMRLEDSLSTKGINSLSNEIEIAKYNSKIKGLYIEVSSGGGESLAGNKLYNVLKSFGKPIVSGAYVAASAAYKAILASNEIIGIGDTSEFGSIGSMASINKAFLKYIKENYVDIYSRLSPNKNKSIRELMESDDKSLVLDELDESVKLFQSLVIKERGLNPESSKTTEALKGGIYFAKQAKSIGLIDQIGTEDFAIKRLYSYIK